MTGVGSRSFDDSFRQEFERRFSCLFRYVDRLSGDPDLAADIVQEAFIRLYQRGSMPTNVGAWLAVVARNLFRNARSKSKRRRRLLAREDAERLVADSRPSPETNLDTLEHERPSVPHSRDCRYVNVICFYLDTLDTVTASLPRYWT
jgi:RNA polymerase sigma-70 factor (ECF subfamily)